MPREPKRLNQNFKRKKRKTKPNGKASLLKEIACRSYLMNERPPMVSFVESVQGKRILLTVHDSRHRSLLKSLSGKREFLHPRYWWVSYDTEAELVTLFETLRDAGFAFVGGPSGWPPAA